MAKTPEEIEILNSIRQKVHQRDEIRERLTGFKKNRYFFKNKLNTQHSPLFNNHPQKNENTGVPLKPQSNKRIRVEYPGATSIKKRNEINKFHSDEFSVEKRPKVSLDSSTENRNRRLFGTVVLGHLKKAKIKLSAEEEHENFRQHKIVDEKIERKLNEEKENLAILRKKDIHERKVKDCDLLLQIKRELMEKENDLIRLHLTLHYKNMKNFICTQSQPMLFWLPKIPNEKSRILQIKTQQFIDEKLKDIQKTCFIYQKEDDNEFENYFKNYVECNEAKDEEEMREKKDEEDMREKKDEDQSIEPLDQEENKQINTSYTDQFDPNEVISNEISPQNQIVLSDALVDVYTSDRDLYIMEGSNLSNDTENITYKHTNDERWNDSETSVNINEGSDQPTLSAKNLENEESQNVEDDENMFVDVEDDSID